MMDHEGRRTDYDGQTWRRSVGTMGRRDQALAYFKAQCAEGKHKAVFFSKRKPTVLKCACGQWTWTRAS